MVVFLSQFVGLHSKLCNQLNLPRHAANVLDHLVKGLLIVCLHVENLKLLQKEVGAAAHKSLHHLNLKRVLYHVLFELVKSDHS